MLYSCTHTATVGVKGLTVSRLNVQANYTSADARTSKLNLKISNKHQRDHTESMVLH